MFVSATYTRAAKRKREKVNFAISKPETRSFVKSCSCRRATRRARVHDAIECHREDWSSVLRDKNLFSIMSEDTFLVRHRRASGLSELRARRNSFIGHYFGTLLLTASQSSGAISSSFLVVHYPISPSQPPPPHQRLSGIISGPFAVMTCVYTPAKNISNKAPAAANSPGNYC